MDNTEINSLFEIAINLENKGLYAQADKARNIMVRLSQGGMYFQSGYGGKTAPSIKMPKITPDMTEDENSRTYFGVLKTPKINIKPNSNYAIVNSFTEQINRLDPVLTSLGIVGFAAFVGKNTQLAALALTPAAFGDLWRRTRELESLIPRLNFKGYWSGEDTAAIEVASHILGILADICDVIAVFVPAFAVWSGIFYGLSVTVNPEYVMNIGYLAGGMPGGIDQMQDIQRFDMSGVTDPYILKILESILVDLGIDPKNNNKILNASKLPKPIGGLDFFIPYISKFDTQKKFKDLTSSQQSVKTMELKKIFPGIIAYIKYLQSLQKPKGK